MKKPAKRYEPHLKLREHALLPGEEWQPRLPGWSLIQISRGAGYWLAGPASTELETGAVLLVAGGAAGCIRASQLNGLAFQCFKVIPARLSGLITLGEQASLAQAAGRAELALRVLPAGHAAAVQMAALCAAPDRDGLRVRLGLLLVVIEVLGKALEPSAAAPEAELADARERLRQFLAETPPDALLELRFNELARRIGCTPRHLSRIFFELVGMSFRDKRAEIRLGRARELLATGQTKVVEVALESGYKSLSFFNLMFARRFGISPGRWRQQNGVSLVNETRRSHRTRRLAA